jgi:hypothetical protein
MTDIIYGRKKNVTHQWKKVAISSSDLSLPPGYDCPIILAAMQTYNGSDTAEVRMRSLSACSFEVKIEEESSDDSETQHAAEDVGYLGLPQGYLYDKNDKVIGYSSVLDVSQRGANAWIPVPVPTMFSVNNSIVFLQVLTFNGSDPIHPRIMKEHPSSGDPGFYFKLEEWPTYDKWHTTERVAMVVLKKGEHAMGSSSRPRLKVGEVKNVKTGWKNVNLGNTTGAGRPVLITQCQTYKGADPVVTRQREISSLKAQVRVQEAESGGSHPNGEMVGYVAVGIS